MDLEPGTRVGSYRVIGAIGRGGMGGVFEVEDDAGRRFALKSPVQDAPGADVARRFAREANALRVLDHPNLVAATDVFVEAGHLFLVMEKVAGRTLTVRLNEPVDPRTALVLARQILDGVEHAHTRGIVHRDLKPDNVLLVPMGGWDRVKIIDFGLVKLIGDAAAAFGANALTRTGLVFGTPAYMAPEQALGRLVDARADVYAIGVILYVELARPGKVVARNTVASMQAGLIYGYAGMVDALVERIRAEVEFPARCIATGGLAPLIATETRTIEATDELLTLKGLKILYHRNAVEKP